MAATGSAACPVNIHHPATCSHWVYSIFPCHNFKCIVTLEHSRIRTKEHESRWAVSYHREKFRVWLSHMRVLTEPRSSSAATQYHELHNSWHYPRWQNWGEIKNRRVAERRSKTDQNPLLFFFSDMKTHYSILPIQTGTSATPVRIYFCFLCYLCPHVSKMVRVWDLQKTTKEQKIMRLTM
jgi:hypothetical protein